VKRKTDLPSVLGWAIVGLVLCGAGTALAQGDLIIYPKKGQSQEQQSKDRYECHAWAVKETGFDPSAPPPTADVSAPPPPATEGGAVRGAARGAALGAIGGAIAGDAGKGAAVGAGVGAAGGAMRRRGAQREQAATQQQQTQQQQAAIEKKRSAYRRAMSACLEARDYTVQ
jgi:hypothetical protein